MAPTGNYTGISVTTLISAGAVPSNIPQVGGSTLQGPAFQNETSTSTYTISGNSPSTGQATITLTPVDSADCSQIVANLLSGGNWISVNGLTPTAYQDPTSGGLPAAQTACSSGSVSAITN